jgi:hypothetical protein
MRVTQKNIWDASATPSGIKRELYVCMLLAMYRWSKDMTLLLLVEAIECQWNLAFGNNAWVDYKFMIAEATVRELF